ncbi:MAG: hypothetical protein ACPGSL_07085, partial [Vicingaceae bacterium]
VHKTISGVYSKEIKDDKLFKKATDLADNFAELGTSTDNFIEFSSHYNLVNQIIKCFKEYNNLPLANK